MGRRPPLNDDHATYLNSWNNKTRQLSTDLLDILCFKPSTVVVGEFRYKYYDIEKALELVRSGARLICCWDLEYIHQINDKDAQLYNKLVRSAPDCLFDYDMSDPP